MDRLYQAIERAINEEIDGAEFERCAADLLRAHYPSLRPLSGGNDAGQDGLFELPDGRRGFLVATTQQNYASNLRKSIRSHIRAGGERRVVVLATTWPVSGQRREKLQRELDADFGFTLHDVHDHGEFVNLLYRSPKWRRDLLGVLGVAGALTRIPPTAPLMPLMPLIGRKAELEQLRSAQGDLIVVGKPGVGKTFLFEQLMEEGWGLFDARRDIPDLEDAIRDVQPRRVIIDDAHFASGDRVGQVLHLRREMEGHFAVVVVTWPGYLDEVRARLSEAEVVEVEELDRAEIIEVIRAAGLHGPDDLLREINDQVRGRAGLAVVLAQACLSGDTFEVATGRRLLSNLTHWYKRVLANPKADCGEIFGVLALAGDAGASAAEVAAALGEPESSVREAIRSLAVGGTIDEIRSWRASGARRLVLQPKNLRAAAVEQCFTGPGSMELEATVERLHQTSGVGLSLTEAALRGAPIRRDTIRRYLHWSDRESVLAFGCLGEQELREAIQAAPQHAVSIATEAYRAGVGTTYALRVLLDHAMGSNGPLNKDGWDPLRVIAHHLHGTRSTIEDRRLVIQVTDQWLCDGGHPEVGGWALNHALHPGVDESSLDPGLGNTVQLFRGIQSPQVVAQIAGLWDSTLDVVARHPGMPIGPLSDALLDWFFPQRMTLDSGTRITSEMQAAMRNAGEQALRRLVGLFETRPTALRVLQELALHPRVDVQIPFALPDHTDALVPLERSAWGGKGGWQEWEQATSTKVRRLAEEVATMDLAMLCRFIVDTFVEISRERTITDQFHLLMIELGDLVDRPGDLLVELEAANAPWACRMHFLERVVADQTTGWEETLAKYVGEDDSWQAVLLALRYPVGDILKSQAVLRVDARHLAGIDTLIIRSELDEGTLSALLESPEQEVAGHVALTLGSRRGDETQANVPERLDSRWHEVVASLFARGTIREGWRFSEIFKHDLGLFVEAMERWFEANSSGGHSRLPIRFEESIRSLPVDTRMMLIARIPGDVASSAIGAAVEALVSEDLETMQALFGRRELHRLHRHGLVGDPSVSWLRRALSAMDCGWSAGKIVSCSLPSHGARWGDERVHWQERIDAFESLKVMVEKEEDPRASRIIEAGIEHFAKLRDASLAGERQSRVFGTAID